MNDFWYIYISGRNKVVEERVYQQWLVLLPRGFQDKNLYNFKAFFDKATGKDIDNRPAEEIMAEIDEAMRRLEKDGN